MNALPQQDALTVRMPAASLTLLDEAELARTTHQTTRSLNGLTATLIGLIDAIRSYSPTTRTRDSRTWGPFGPDAKQTKNLDWQTRLIISRDMLVATAFDFELGVHEIGTADTAWFDLIRGTFDAGTTASAGTGHIEIVLAAARAAGFDASDWGNIDHVEIDYRNPRPTTDGDPIHIAMHITDLDDDATDALPAPTAAYDYRETAEEQGQMTFDVFANIVPPATQMEHVNITSLWLPTGQGRAQMTVVSGDGAGAQQTECWNRLFQPTFNSKPWAPGEDVGTDPSVCVAITPLSAPAF
ncbi:MAG TPA: hypothetical protein VHJ20_05565 [Polyangia bacterium]|nr:hypothetical protein [Polyangia bacterium]